MLEKIQRDNGCQLLDRGGGEGENCLKNTLVSKCLSLKSLIFKSYPLKSMSNNDVNEMI